MKRGVLAALALGIGLTSAACKHSPGATPDAGRPLARDDGGAGVRDAGRAGPARIPPSSAQAGDAIAPQPAAMNVLLIIVDSLRADMPWAGNKRDVAPWLTHFEAQAVDFTRAYSLASVTARSVGPLLASHYASEMEPTGDFFTAYYPKNRFLAERLQDRGRRTLGAFAHAYFSRSRGCWPGAVQGRDRTLGRYAETPREA